MRDLLIVDDMLPCPASPVRTAEYRHYMETYDAELASTCGWGKWGLPTFEENLASLNWPQALSSRVVPIGQAGDARLAYVTFLSNAQSLLPWFQARALPFVLQLYPGSGFDLTSGEAVRGVVESPLCRKVIVTQEVTRSFVPAEKAEFIYGGPFPLPPKFDFWKDKAFSKDKLDICFVAHKYKGNLYAKGFAQLVEVMRELDRPVNVHVVGDYGPADGAMDATYYGAQPAEFFQTFYPRMDIILSLNRAGEIRPGRFDGFPTGACIEAGLYGVLNCLTDPLGLNIALEPWRDFVPVTEDTAVQILRDLLDNPGRLHELAFNNYRAFTRLFDANMQLARRRAVIDALLA